MNRLTAAALRAYPPSFRERYGPELTALVEDLPTTPRNTVDLLVGAARAWLRPRFGADGRRGRLQATLATTWLAWCAGFLAAPAIDRALLDPPVAAAGRGVRDLLDAAQVLFVVGWALALIGAAPVVLRAVLPAVRARSWPTLRPLLPALVLGLIEGLGLVTLTLLRGNLNSHPPGTVLLLGALWLVGFAAFVASLGLGPVLALRRLGPGPEVLRPSVLVSLPLALTLTGLTGCCLAAVAHGGDATLLSSGLPVVAVLVVAGVASLVALTSSIRGLGAIRT